MIKALTVLALGLALAVSGAFGVAHQTSQDDVAVVPVDAPGRPTGDIESQVAALESQVGDQPRDGRTWATLAHVYVERARLNGDPTNYDRARDALRKAFDLNGPDDDLALAGEAALAAAKHHFGQALHHAQRALRVNPYQAVALAIRIDAMTELGRYDGQLRSLAQADRRAPGSAVLTRRSYAEELRGDIAGAGRMLRKALRLARSDTDRAYLLTQVAELDRRSGRLATAERHLRAATAADPRYVPAWASRARLAAARGDLRSAERWWRKVNETSPNFDSALELGEVYEVTGRDRLADRWFDEAAEIVAGEAATGVHGELETATLEADHGSARMALRAARVEWSRRHSVHVADALAWALHRTGRSEEALRYSRVATRLGTPDAQFWIHRGLIEDAVGRPRAADRHLAYALRLDSGVRPVLVAAAGSALRSTS
ncbi:MULTISPECIES: tetratricopeptide repeat protein [unclassified Nocardioides]|uniref:tetratricopeptide repeat protein n=1 Tax=unclassified Nocardioides TaxID=2615069 RepID=UPI0036146467